MELIGKGAFSRVYKTRKVDGTIVAIKCVNHASKRGLNSLMESYISLYIRNQFLNNSNEINIDQNGGIYIVQELFDNDLSVYLRKSGSPLSKSLLKLWMWQLLCSVATLHSKSILHGDIKPSNILISKSGIKLSDFSLSALLENSDFCGCKYTFLYRAPEVLEKKECSFPADIWALGCTFRKMGFGHETEDFLSLINGMLKINPNDRPTCLELSKNSFFSGMSDFPTGEAKFIESSYYEKIIDNIRSLTEDTYKNDIYELVASKLIQKNLDDIKNFSIDYMDIQNEIELVRKINFDFLPK